MLNSPAPNERFENLLSQASAVSKPQQRQPVPISQPPSLITSFMHRLPPQSFPVFKTKTVPPAKAHPSPCRAYQLLSMIYPGTQYNKKPQAAHFCRIRFLHFGFGASLRSTNQTQSAKGLFNSGKMPRLMVYEKYEIPTPAHNKKNAG